MSEDNRNSIYLWVGGFACFGVVWAIGHFEVFRGISVWLWPVVGIAALTNFVKIGWGFWKRRASNAMNPDQS